MINQINASLSAVKKFQKVTKQKLILEQLDIKGAQKVRNLQF